MFKYLLLFVFLSSIARGQFYSPSPFEYEVPVQTVDVSDNIKYLIVFREETSTLDYDKNGNLTYGAKKVRTSKTFNSKKELLGFLNDELFHIWDTYEKTHSYPKKKFSE